MPLTTIQPTLAEWDRFAQAHGGHFLQSSRWGALKRDFGWRDQIIAVGQGGQIAAGALVLLRPLPLRLGSIAYIPRGPVVDWNETETIGALLSALDAAARAGRAVLLKVEPDIEDTPAARNQLTALGFRPSPHEVQPPRTILLDIANDETMLARMNQGTRRKIRTAEKREIVVRQGDARDVDSFNALMTVTGQRDQFGVHSPAYYRAAFDLFAPDHAALFLASYGGRDLAGLMVFALGKTACYLYGASSSEERERMPNHALQWAAIRWARERGCRVYDLWGIPDADEATLEAQFQSRSDGLWGVYGFKRGFGGRIWRAVGAWDRVYNSTMYTVYKIVAGLRRGDAA